MTKSTMSELTEKVKTLEKIMGCNCDLDNWEPEKSTGHSFVCRIHILATDVGARHD